jgi:hypothetical protein
MREVAVVREQKCARRVGVETSDGNDARLLRDEVDDGPPALGIARRGHDAGRLVQKDVGEALALNAGTVDLHEIVSSDHRVQLAGCTVDAYSSRSDQLVGTPARGDPGSGEVGIEAHAGILAG